MMLTYFLAILALALLFHYIDHRQTLVIARPGGWHEKNPIIGHDPTRRQVHSYFGYLTPLLVSHKVGWFIGMPKVGMLFAAAWLLVGLVATVRNRFKLGIKL